MIYFITAFFIVCIIGIKLRPDDGNSIVADYMSIEKTMAVKGFFILIVFFSHFNSYVSYTQPIDVAYVHAFSQIGQRMVTMFLFYSGFGVMESIKKRHMSYVHKIPVKRIVGVLLRFDIAIGLFAIVNLIFGTKMSVKQILLSLVAWDAIGNSNWYIFAVLVLYAVTFVCFEIFRERKSYFPSALLVLIVVGVIVLVFHIFELRKLYWYDTMICYPLGILYSLMHEKLESIVKKNDTVYALILAAGIVITHISFKYSSKRFIADEICMVSFVVVILLVTMKISVNNKVLRWFGKHLFEVYILQRIPMIVFLNLGLHNVNLYLYFVCSFATTVLLAWLFGKFVSPLCDKIVSGKGTKKIEKSLIIKNS